MTTWAYTPGYRFFVFQTPAQAPVVQRSTNRRPRAYRLTSLLQLQGSLVTAGQVGQLTASFADTDGSLRRVVNPQPMNQVQLWLQSRCAAVGSAPAGPQFLGGWRPAWTGYIDVVDHHVDPQQGATVVLHCSSPQKLWEVTSQEEGDAFLRFASSTTNNVSGSILLEYTALQIGYKTEMLRIDPYANSGTGYQTNTISQGSWNPDLQTWGAVMEAFLSSSGLEWYFDEEGRGVWRRVGFLGQLPLERVMDPAEIVTATLSTSDVGVYTDVEVRPQFGGVTGYAAQTGNVPNTTPGPLSPNTVLDTTQSIGLWPARDDRYGPPYQETEVMRQHIGRRLLVAYAPWVTSNAQKAGDYLAQVLGYQAAAGVLHGQVTLVADPQFRIGTIVLIPPLPSDPSPWIIDDRLLSEDRGTLFYINSVTYNLVWGQSWFMTLGLTYGHSRHNDFPYLKRKDGKGILNYPVLHAEDATTLQLADAGFLTKETLSYYRFTVLPAAPSPNGLTPKGIGGKNNPLAPNEIAVDPNIFKMGVEVQLRMPDGSQPPKGKSHNGYYKTRAAPLGSGLVIYADVPYEVDDVQMVDPTGTVLDIPHDTGTNIPGAGQLPGNVPTFDPRRPVTREYNLQTTNLNPPNVRGIVGQALDFAYTRAGRRYEHGNAGPDAWDCSGLIAWAFYQVGVPATFQPASGSGYNTDGGPGGIYDYFVNLKATVGYGKDAVAKAAAGSLIFTGVPRDGGHIAFSIGDNYNFGANSQPNNIGESSNDTLLDGANQPFDRVLDLSTVDWKQIPGAGHVIGAPSSRSYPQPVQPDTLAGKAYNFALTFGDVPGGIRHYTQYQPGSTAAVRPGQHSPKDGKPEFDCAGLVVYCFFQYGFLWDNKVTRGADGSINYAFNAADIYKYLVAHPDVQTSSVADSAVGDLIFCGPVGQSVDFIQHVGWCTKEGGLASGKTFGANNPRDGIKEFDMANYESENVHIPPPNGPKFTTPIAYALNVSQLQAGP